MVDWLNGRLRVAKKYDGAPSSTPPFDSSYPLVFTHFDLRPENLILDEKDQLWVIDFGQAGFYPEPFEYLAMFSTWVAHRSQITRLGTTFLTSIVAGFYRSYYETKCRALQWAVDVGQLIEAE